MMQNSKPSNPLIEGLRAAVAPPTKLEYVVWDLSKALAAAVDQGRTPDKRLADALEIVRRINDD